MKTLKNVNRKGTADFDERSFWKKLQDNARTMGYQLDLRALELFYPMVDPATPLKAKLVIAGALNPPPIAADLSPEMLDKAREKADALFRRSSVTHKSTASC